MDFLNCVIFMSKSTAQGYLKYKKDSFCILFGIDYVQVCIDKNQRFPLYRNRATNL